jgi:cadmium resistance protein CadD (predicted permease)
METIIGILGLIIIVLGFTTWNLLMKNEKAEDLINEQDTLINDLTSSVIKIDEVITQLDSSGAFENDDEIGTFFEQIKSMRDTLLNNLDKKVENNV